MSLDGLEKLAPMGYIPLPPPQYQVHHTADPISVAADETFDRWIALPEGDGRTIEEFAANPVEREVTWHFGKPSPPPAPPNRKIREGVQPPRGGTGEMKASFGGVHAYRRGGIITLGSGVEYVQAQESGSQSSHAPSSRTSDQSASEEGDNDFPRPEFRRV